MRELKELYYKPGSPIAYAGMNTVYKYFKGRLSMKEIKSFLQTSESYSLHFPFKRAKIYNPTYVRYKRQSFQVDIIYMLEFSKENDAIKYMLCCIDVFTRFMWCEPLKNIKSKDVTAAMRKILRRCGGKPKTMTSDKGPEFIGKPFKDLMAENNIKTYLSNGKCGIVERAQQTLKRIIYKYFSEKDQLRYLDKLKDFIKTYNLHYHRFLKMSPIDAEKEINKNLVLNAHLSHFLNIQKKRKDAKFKLGDFVRISMERSKFKRSYDQTAVYEVFKIISVNKDLPVERYTLQDESKEVIDGHFTASEIVKVDLADYKVNVLKTRKRKNKTEYFVTYKGYPDTYNEWIDASQLRRL